MSRYDVRARFATVVFDGIELNKEMKARDALRREVHGYNAPRGELRPRGPNSEYRLNRAFETYLANGRANGRQEFANAMAGDLKNALLRTRIASAFQLTPKRGIVAKLKDVCDDIGLTHMAKSMETPYPDRFKDRAYRSPR